MTSAVTICSNALLQVGDKPIASLSESTDRALICANLWPQVRDYILRKHPWPCARVTVDLAPEATAYSADWACSYLLPGDCMRVWQVGQRGWRYDYERQGRRILTDATSLFLVYQKRLEDPTQWDADMVDAASAEMAARLAYPITKSASLAELMTGKARAAMALAQAVAGQDNPGEDWADSPFIDVRG